MSRGENGKFRTKVQRGKQWKLSEKHLRDDSQNCPKAENPPTRSKHRASPAAPNTSVQRESGQERGRTWANERIAQCVAGAGLDVLYVAWSCQMSSLPLSQSARVAGAGDGRGFRWSKRGFRRMVRGWRCGVSPFPNNQRARICRGDGWAWFTVVETWLPVADARC